MINIGYACPALPVHDTEFKSCTMKNSTNERLTELIKQNLLFIGNLVITSEMKLGCLELVQILYFLGQVL